MTLEHVSVSTASSLRGLLYIFQLKQILMCYCHFRMKMNKLISKDVRYRSVTFSCKTKPFARFRREMEGMA